ncbi:MAG: adenylosuccinate synthetase, partial [Clostridia bacterium]|nr:adenylosuccinate synthetase [Clostridia bacterium]
MITSVVGLNWGDEGKGRMVDYFAGKADCVIRYQGGDNAGHTVVNELGKFAFHNFPSGVCYPGVINIIASGSVVSPDSFISELKDVESKGLKVENIYISDRAILIMP